MVHSGLVPALSKRSLTNCITQKLEKFRGFSLRLLF